MGVPLLSGSTPDCCCYSRPEDDAPSIGLATVWHLLIAGFSPNQRFWHKQLSFFSGTLIFLF
jgi:hypothetical protein